MMAANYRHIGGLENRLGRHYSRFSASWPAAPLAAQSLARRKSPNHGSNRRSPVRRAAPAAHNSASNEQLGGAEGDRIREERRRWYPDERGRPDRRDAAGE